MAIGFRIDLVDVDPGVDVVELDLEVVAGLPTWERAAEEGCQAFVSRHPEVGEDREGRDG